MKGFLLGMAAGYVLGAKAGRSRYEEIAKNWQRVMDYPAVQSTAGAVRTRFNEMVGSVERPAHAQEEARTAGTTPPQGRSASPYAKNAAEREPGASISASRVGRPQ